MRTILRLTLFLLLSSLLLVPSSVLAQNYLFSLDQMDVNVYYNEDGTATIDYVFTFSNQPQGHSIDYIDIGIPNGSFSTSGIEASIEGKPIGDISRGEYEGDGTGFAVALGPDAIQPGQTARVRVVIPNVGRVLYPDDEDSNYASAVFSPTWFGSQFLVDSTNTTVTFHLPPGVLPDEPKWHAAPEGFPATPETGIDEQGRITYTWHNPSSYASSQYLFGASFPKQYVPASSIVTPGFFERLGIDPESIISCLFCSGFIGFFLFTAFWSVRSSRKRKLQYLPPKVSIEGHGIKRGLTAVEAAILLEQPMDKILTMILFSAVKKNAASVISNDPLELQTVTPLPEGLRTYETNFLEAFQEKDKKARRKALQNMMIDLVKTVSKKMKGFSRKESVNYYKDITKRAWAQVEASNTPEVKSEKYEQVMEWTMLDGDYERRTRDVFQSGPVYAPIWWPRYSPSYRPVATSGPRPAGTTISGSGQSGGSMSMPTLPGAAFAAGVVNGAQNFSAGVIGNVTDFTSAVTNRTNPVPVSKSSGGFSSSSGGGCACACACAGCACACAGGGR